MARSILSLGMFWARAACTAVLRRAFMAGSGRPILAAAVISRASLENSLDRFLSCAPLRNWMFLNLEWPAMASWSLLVSGLIGGRLCKIKGRAAAQGESAPFRKALTLKARL